MINIPKSMIGQFQKSADFKEAYQMWKDGKRLDLDALQKVPKVLEDFKHTLDKLQVTQVNPIDNKVIQEIRALKVAVDHPDSKLIQEIKDLKHAIKHADPIVIQKVEELKEAIEEAPEELFGEVSDNPKNNSYEPDVKANPIGVGGWIVSGIGIIAVIVLAKALVNQSREAGRDTVFRHPFKRKV